mgnify:CR=1 FL=1
MTHTVMAHTIMYRIAHTVIDSMTHAVIECMMDTNTPYDTYDHPTYDAHGPTAYGWRMHL